MARCSHGYDQGQCLICQLDAPAGVSVDERAGAGRTGWFSGRRAPAPATFSGPPAERRHHPMATLALVAVLAVAAILAGWVLIGTVYAILRIFEIVAVAFAAGWVGYRVGHWRGRHGR